jgi:hypothetical protein
MQTSATKRSLVAVVVMLVVALMPSGVFAGVNTVEGITLTTPDTYGSCEATGDSVRVYNGSTGVRRVVGQLIVEYVTESGRTLVPGGFYPVDVTLQPGQQYDLSVTYPPAAEWPQYSATNPIRELHVDVQLEIVINNIFVGSIGYGQDWDVFCHGDFPPPPEVFEGCTPGYWKTHLSAWGSVSPAAKVNSVFSGPYLDSKLGNATLQQALSFKGGSSLAGAQQILLRAAVAAYLNASSSGVDYPLTTQQVVDQVNAALNTSDREYVINTASQLDSFNNLGCPLN